MSTGLPSAQHRDRLGRRERSCYTVSVPPGQRMNVDVEWVWRGVV